MAKYFKYQFPDKSRKFIVKEIVQNIKRVAILGTSKLNKRKSCDSAPGLHISPSKSVTQCSCESGVPKRGVTWLVTVSGGWGESKIDHGY